MRRDWGEGDKSLIARRNGKEGAFEKEKKERQ